MNKLNTANVTIGLCILCNDGHVLRNGICYACEHTMSLANAKSALLTRGFTHIVTVSGPVPIMQWWPFVPDDRTMELYDSIMRDPVTSELYQAIKLEN